MYGPKWLFLLMYGSHDRRHTGFPRVNGGQRDPRDLRRYNISTCKALIVAPYPTRLVDPNQIWGNAVLTFISNPNTKKTKKKSIQM